MNMKLFDSEQKVMEVLWREVAYTSAAIETISDENDTENAATSADDTASTAIIGGADGPTSIFLAGKLGLRQKPKQKNKHQGAVRTAPISHALFRCSATTPANTLCPSAFICS